MNVPEPPSADAAPAMRDRFERIYATGEWGVGSGEGSDPKNNAKYRALLQTFLKEQNIRSVVDFGCGDWQFSRFINWSGVHYRGYDLVRPVVEQNQSQFGKPGVEFHTFSGNFDDLPAADLLIAKDVLQHWSNNTVLAFLPMLRRYPMSLVTNCVFTYGVTANRDIADGDFRRLDIRLPPFSVPAEELLNYVCPRPWWRRLIGRPRWRKTVLLIRCDES